MRPRLKEAYEAELRTARDCAAAGDLPLAFMHLERAHILGQRSTRAHVRAHWEMLRIGRRRGDAREIVGQAVRIFGALLLSRIWVPPGNTGGADVSALASMPIPEELRKLLED